MNEAENFRARFTGRPDFDTEHFRDYTGRIVKGLKVDREGETWEVVEIIENEGDKWATLVFEHVE
jgi:hypothetical protein